MTINTGPAEQKQTACRGAKKETPRRRRSAEDLEARARELLDLLLRPRENCNCRCGSKSYAEFLIFQVIYRAISRNSRARGVFSPDSRSVPRAARSVTVIRRCRAFGKFEFFGKEERQSAARGRGGRDDFEEAVQNLPAAVLHRGARGWDGFFADGYALSVCPRENPRSRCRVSILHRAARIFCLSYFVLLCDGRILPTCCVMAEVSFVYSLFHNFMQKKNVASSHLV